MTGETRGCPPVRVAEQRHDAGQEQPAHDGRVDQHARRQPHAQLLEPGDAPEHQARDGTHHDHRRARDHAAGGGESLDDRRGGGDAAVVGLAHARDDEDLVVHRQAEEHREDEDRHPALELADVVGAEPRRTDAVTEDNHHHAVGGGHRDEVEHDRDQRDDQ